MNILVVDDQRTARLILRDILETEDGVTIFEASSLAEARSLAVEHDIALAFVDIRLSEDPRDRDGLTLLRELRERSAARVLMVSGLRDAAEIRDAFRWGAEDYLLKDELDEDTVRAVVQRVRDQVRLEREVHALRAHAFSARDVPGIVGNSAPMRRLRELIRRVATSNRPVLVKGPSGSGKELVVRAIHALGPRPDEPLFDVNCGALPEALVEAHLFGHERGAFTGAERKHEGYLAAVGSGTLFLDEIAELPMPLQPKLLRVLETRRYRPVGGTSELVFKGRVIAATHADLHQRVREGRFREDLLHRLDVLAIRVPALDEHPEDIPELIAHFAREQPRKLRFAPEAVERLVKGPWTGNVRQLRNTIDRIAVLTDDDPVTAATVESVLPSREWSGEELPTLAREILRLDGLGDRLAAIERALVAEALRIANGNKSEAARLLGVHRKRIESRGAPVARRAREDRPFATIPSVHCGRTRARTVVRARKNLPARRLLDLPVGSSKSIRWRSPCATRSKGSEPASSSRWALCGSRRAPPWPVPRGIGASAGRIPVRNAVSGRSASDGKTADASITGRRPCAFRGPTAPASGADRFPIDLELPATSRAPRGRAPS